jgi:hypothetical protein
MGASVVGIGRGFQNLGATLAGRPEDRVDTTAPVSFGNFLGEAKPIGVSGNFGRDLLDAVGVGAEAASFMPVVAGTKGVVAATRTGRALQAAGAGLKAGAVGGTLAGGGFEAQEEDATAGSIAGSAALGSVFGGVFGTAIGGASGLVGKTMNVVKGRQAMQKELNAMLSDPTTPISQRVNERVGGQPLATVARGDKTIREAVKQQVDAPTAFLVRHSTPEDKVRMNEMLEIAQRALDNPVAVERSSDVVGRSFVNRTNHLLRVREQAGRQINEAAEALRGQATDFSPAQARFQQDLAQAGVSVGDDGKLVFTGSQFEGLPAVENLLQRIFQRASQLGDDAFDGHTLKRFIDEQVTYGKSAEGLAGTGERIAKNFRRMIDGTLDENFPQYADANKLWGQSTDILDEVSRLFGDDIRTGGEIAASRAGSVMRRVFGNSPNRANILAATNDLDTFVRANGLQTGDDILTQLAFHNELERIFGSQAATGLETAVERATGRAFEGVLKGRSLLQIGTDVAKAGIERARGINQKNQIEAIRNLLQ